MPRTLKLHLDECCHAEIAKRLRLHGIDVTTTPESNLMSMTDEDQLEFARNAGRVLFTHDTDFLAFHSQGVEHTGLAYSDRNLRSLGDMVRLLILLWELYDADEMVNRLEFL